eukprot:COSAG01_NODE_71072_length_257_cov_0.588608_2_plen_33_part_01
MLLSLAVPGGTHQRSVASASFYTTYHQITCLSS